MFSGDALVETIESHLSEEMKEGPRLSFEQRNAYAFLHPWDANGDCYSWRSSNKIEYHNLEVVKILLMLGELEPILQACAHPLSPRPLSTHPSHPFLTLATPTRLLAALKPHAGRLVVGWVTTSESLLLYVLFSF
jgi:hypothetical protein